MNKDIKVLTIDGGGSKGIYSLGILAELEAKLGGSLSKYFDLFYGCSTGAVIAAALSLGKPVDYIKKMYYEKLPWIMNGWSSGQRTKRLRQMLNDEFGNHSIDNIKKPLCIVATSMNEKKVKIFKSHKIMAHGLENSFNPFFGVPFVDALMASCSAVPLFKKTDIVTPEESSYVLIDGGFSSSNPSLFAIIDAKKFKRENEKVKILNIGTGSFPEAKNLRIMISGISHYASAKLLTTMIDVGANTVGWIAENLSADVAYLRISKNYSDNNLKTSILENNAEMFKILHQLGRDTFGEFEKSIQEFLDSR